MDWKNRYNPVIKKRYLFMIAGILWSLVGIVLSAVGLYWMFPVRHTFVVVLMPFAFIIGFIKGKFVLFKAANRASERIYAHPEKACFGSVFSWKAWLVILLMILLGQTLRKFIVPINYRDCLGLVYVLIGPALFTASYVYWKNFFKYSEILVKKSGTAN